MALAHTASTEPNFRRKPRLTKSQADKLRRLIERYGDARIEDSWKGGGDPDAIPEIELALRKATRDLNNFIRRLERS